MFQMLKIAVISVFTVALILTASTTAAGKIKKLSKDSKRCLKCHVKDSPGIVEHWKSSKHAEENVGCYECHQADPKDADAYQHNEEAWISVIVSPKDCARCHENETSEFKASHHAKAGNILESLDNRLAETVEGNRTPFNPHGKIPGGDMTKVNGMASLTSGCLQCHGSKVGLKTTDGRIITADDLKLDKDGFPIDQALLKTIKRNDEDAPIFDHNTWPNTGIGRINLDGSKGSCASCHSRHDFSARRARQPENCAKCHMGPDHPQKEIFEESKHGVAYRDLKDKLNLDSETWVLGKDYSAAPTCASCHMSGNINNKGKVTHDPGKRISWTNRPPLSLHMDTDKDHKVIKETDPKKRAALIADSAKEKRKRMTKACVVCHSDTYVGGFYKQYDDFIKLYNEKFARPGKEIMEALKKGGLISKPAFDEEIEWTWFYLWHHEGRRARHGAAMMAPDYAHWHGMFEVAENFYNKLIPQALEIAHKGAKQGLKKQADRVISLINKILNRPEHQWKNAAQKKK